MTALEILEIAFKHKNVVTHLDKFLSFSCTLVDHRSRVSGRMESDMVWALKREAGGSTGANGHKASRDGMA